MFKYFIFINFVASKLKWERTMGKRFCLFFAAVMTALSGHAQLEAFNTVKKKESRKKVVLRGETGVSAVTQYRTPATGYGEGCRDGSGEGYARDTAYAMLLSVPLESDTLVVNSPYGYRTDPITGKRRFHAGVDLRAAADNVYAIMPGRIAGIGYDKKLGNYVRIDHGDLTITYGHLLTTAGKKGDEVFAGQSVGITGSTGRSTGEHLHVSAKFKGKGIDPLPILRYIQDITHRFRDTSLNTVH